MSYALSFTEPVAESVERVRREELEAAAQELRGEPSGEAVHDARKRLKKTRALLRLARPPGFKARNPGLRGARRAPPGARDADVMAETVQDLAERFPGRAPYEPVHELLAARARATEPGGSAAEIPREPWPLEGLRARALVKSLKRTYVRGRDAFALADREPTAEHLHEWRKRVKDLWYQERLLEAVWPSVMKAQAKEAKKLSKLLGEDHDLAVLAALLRSDPELAALSGDLQDVIAERRAALLERSRALGRRVYADRPKHFARRAGRYVELAA